MTQELADQIAARYKDVPFETLRAEIIGGIRRENVESARFSANMLLRRYEGARCDSDGSSTCIRCNTVFLAKMMVEALESVPTVSDLARAHAEASVQR